MQQMKCTLLWWCYFVTSWRKHRKSIDFVVSEKTWISLFLNGRIMSPAGTKKRMDITYHNIRYEKIVFLTGEKLEKIVLLTGEKLVEDKLSFSYHVSHPLDLHFRQIFLVVCKILSRWATQINFCCLVHSQPTLNSELVKTLVMMHRGWIPYFIARDEFEMSQVEEVVLNGLSVPSHLIM